MIRAGERGFLEIPAGEDTYRLIRISGNQEAPRPLVVHRAEDAPDDTDRRRRVV